MSDNTGRRMPSEFSFESYVERQFVHLNERLNKMGIDIQGLEVDEAVLAEVVPFLTNEVTTLSAEKTAEEAALNEKITQLQTKEGEVAADQAELEKVKGELATAQGELSQVEAIVAKLAPAVQEAEKILPPKQSEPEPTPAPDEGDQPTP